MIELPNGMARMEQKQICTCLRTFAVLQNNPAGRVAFKPNGFEQ